MSANAWDEDEFFNIDEAENMDEVAWNKYWNSEAPQIIESFLSHAVITKLEIPMHPRKAIRDSTAGWFDDIVRAMEENR